jgi:lipopolysaccharide/colanic/teichoic acid biosynthesis glycosyltransferase
VGDGQGALELLPGGRARRLGEGGGDALNRAADVALAGLGLVVAAPALAVAAAAVKLGDGGPVLYRQERVGKDGEPFELLKLRTMVVGAESMGAGAAVDRGDPRITRIGRFLRRSSIDELPQLWNVLKGEMSIVGPRPERPEFVAQLEAEVPFWQRRHLVKPGVTGWAQVRRGYTADAAGTSDKLAYDLWYLRHRSIVLDLAICAKTFSTLVTGSGAR